MGKKKSPRAKHPAKKRARVSQTDSRAKRSKSVDEKPVRPSDFPKSPPPSEQREASNQDEPLHQSKNLPYPIVGIGASAGGLEACSQLLQALPLDTEMVFVVVQHLDPHHSSILSELLSRTTDLPVIEARDGMAMQPGHVYVIPPNADMTIMDGHLKLTKPRIKTAGQFMPVDHFFRSLAETYGPKAIGVILSGSASDGALGLQVIKEVGGITFVQDEKSARFPSMPRSAISTGCVDFVLPPERIAKELATIGQHPYLIHPEPEEAVAPPSRREDHITRILVLLVAITGVDFTHYKPATLKRRILRRMALHKMYQLKDYVKYLQENRAEVDALYQDMLIKVTSFFREPEAFEALKEKIFPEIMKIRSSDAPIRIWVPGCSTGEEVYSLAIALLEFLGDSASQTPVQIFGTDISEVALEKARSGTYIENIALDVSLERLRRFFAKVEGHYRISKYIRDLCVFAKQDVTRDPPFSKLDLISCRNLLIYLGPALQKRVLPIFHYTLNPGGFLMLGVSESIGSFSNLFERVDQKYKIYSKTGVSAPTIHYYFNLSTASIREPRTLEASGQIASLPWGELDMQKEADRIVLNQYGPAGVVVNESMEILQFRGYTGPYLEPAPGQASLNLMKMLREGLLGELRAAFHRAKKEQIPVRRENILVKHQEKLRSVNFEVIPFKVRPSKEQFFLVLFEPATNPARQEPIKTKPQRSTTTKGRRKDESRQMVQLRQELAATKEYLQSIIEEREATNEELKSANEEVLSSNEELQSTNEELETAKEELQSTNEELSTVNDELQNRNLDLSILNNDLNNLLGSVNIPIIMLGQDLRIRRFTPMAEKVLNLIPSDIGRPISDINLHINIPNLEQIVLQVIDSMQTRDLEVQDQKGYWYSMRVQPYKTLENKIDGAVLTFIDIHQLKKSLDELKQSRQKEVLLKEIHHRVKNNLQIISSLLSLQSEYIKDKQALEMFRESQNRVRSMALIHETLYRSEDPARINLVEYVQELVTNLFRSYGIGPDRIKLNLDVTDGFLNTDTSISCGLIINELVSNALKHAFSGDRQGELHVGLRSEGGRFTLTVRDNGKGLPKDLDIHNTKSLGLQLVNTVTNQLGARAEVHSNGGTEFKITFNEPKHNKKDETPLAGGGKISRGSRTPTTR